VMDLATNDETCRKLCRGTACVVFAVEYVLLPSTSFRLRLRLVSRPCDGWRSMHTIAMLILTKSQLRTIVPVVIAPPLWLREFVIRAGLGFAVSFSCTRLRIVLRHQHWRKGYLLIGSDARTSSVLEHLVAVPAGSLSSDSWENRQPLFVPAFTDVEQEEEDNCY
jgi:hypothetical protein